MPDHAHIPYGWDTEDFDVAAARNENTTSEVSPRPSIRYRSMGTQTLPPLNGNAFKEMYGRDPVGQEFERKIGLAALGRYYPEAVEKLHEPRCDGLQFPSPAGMNASYVHTGFQTKLYQERKMALTRAKALATMTANKYRSVAAKAGYHVWTEMNEENIVHSEQFLVKVTFDDNGNAVDQDINGRMFPNIYGEKVRLNLASIDPVRQQERQRSQLGYTFAQSRGYQSRASLPQCHTTSEISTPLALRQNIGEKSSHKITTFQPSPRDDVPVLDILGHYRDQLNTEFTVMDAKENHHSQPSGELTSVTTSSGKRKLVGPAECRLNIRYPKRGKWLDEHDAVQGPEDFAFSGKSTDTALTPPSGQIITEKMMFESSDQQKERSPLEWPHRAHSGPYPDKHSSTHHESTLTFEKHDHRSRAHETDLYEASDHEERVVLNTARQRSPTMDSEVHYDASRARKEQDDENINNVVTSTRALKHGQSKCSPLREREVTPGSATQLCLRTNTTAESPKAYCQSSQKGKDALVSSRSEKVVGHDGRTSRAQTSEECQQDHNDDVESGRHDSIRGHKFGSQVMKTIRAVGQEQHRTLQNANNIARTREELERRRELRSKALNTAKTKRHTKNSSKYATESSQQTIKAGVDLNGNAKLIELRNTKHTSVLRSYESEARQRKGPCVKDVTATESSRSDVLSAHPFLQAISKRSHNESNDADRTHVSLRAAEKTTSPRIRRALREEIVRYVPRALRQNPQKGTQESNDGGKNDRSREQEREHRSKDGDRRKGRKH